jgi:HEAT repeat protein
MEFVSMGPLWLSALLLTSDPQLHQFVHKQNFNEAIKRAFILHNEDSFDAQSAEKLATSLIEKGLNSPKPEETLLSLYAALICEKELEIDKLNSLFHLQIPHMQHMILSHLEKIELTSSYPILKEALSGMDLGVRLHACQILAHSGHKEGLAQLESLMYRLPPQLRYIFADLFAQIGSKEAHIHLKTLLEDKLWTNRVAALLAVADYKQDGLLNYVKASASHTQPAEVEAAVYGLGVLGDHQAIVKLEQLLNHNTPEVRLASALSLSRLGVESGKTYILTQAKHLDLFAINLLSELNLPEEKLSFLFEKHDLTHRLNSTLTLLKKRHKTGLIEAYSLLKDLPPILPKYSPGRTLVSFKIEKKKDILEYALAFRKRFAQMLIHEMFSYPPEEVDIHFIKLLQHKEWVPQITSGLLDRHDEKAITLLKQISETPGNPYLRTQASLQLFLNKPSLHYKRKIMEYMQGASKDEIIRFSNAARSEHRFSELFLEPTPEEKSELLLRCAEALVHHKDKSVVSHFIQLLEEGHLSNRPLIAAFLMVALR